MCCPARAIDISALVPDDYSQYWDMSRSFLQIVARQWPEMCREAGVMDAALRRHRLLGAEAERLEQRRPDLPLVAAGSTGSMPGPRHTTCRCAPEPC